VCFVQVLLQQKAQSAAEHEESNRSIKEQLFASQASLRASQREVTDLRAQKQLVVTELEQIPALSEDNANLRAELCTQTVHSQEAEQLAHAARTQCTQTVEALDRLKEVCNIRYIIGPLLYM
jgi:regulator of replication initiation timing